MSQENVEAFMKSLEALHRGDFDSWVDSFAEEGEFIPQRAAIQGTYRSHKSLREFLADNAESFEVFHLRLRGKGSGIDIEVPSALLVTYREGKVIRFEEVAGTRPETSLYSSSMTLETAPCAQRPLAP